MRWYRDFGVLPFDWKGIRNLRDGLHLIAPGLQSFSFSAYGDVAVWVNGIQQNGFEVQKEKDGLTVIK